MTFPGPILAHLLASPFEGDYRPLAEQLAEQSYLKLVKTSDHLADQLQQTRLPLHRPQGTSESVPFSGWRPEIGAAALGASRGLVRESWNGFAAQVMLAGFLKGDLQAIELCVADSYPLTVAGRTWVGGPCQVKGQGETLTIRTPQSRGVIQLHRLDGGEGVPLWIAEGQSVLKLGSKAASLLTTDTWMDFWFPEAERGKLSQDPETRNRFEQGMSVIETYSPYYYQWITLPLREVVSIEPSLWGTFSQSFAAWPGQVHVPVTTPLNLLISLVHECSHQYHHLLQWHSRLVQPKAPDVYSALKKRPRPLEKVLKGFHAFGNVMLALQALEPFLEHFAPASDSNLSIPSAAMDRELQVIYRSPYQEVVKANQRLITGLDQELQANYQQHFEAPGTALYLALRGRLMDGRLLPSV
jgi:hypothetical protein